MGGICSRRRDASSNSFYHPVPRSPYLNRPSPYSTPQHPRSPYLNRPSPFSTPQHRHASISFNYASPTPQKLNTRFSNISDDYHSLEQVTAALAEAGLESSNLIIGIDFTKSNEWTGAWSFKHKSLHQTGSGLNPYEQAISIIGKSLSPFDEDNLIPCFGFGDASTNDQDVFSFYDDSRYCNGFEEVLRRYRELVPQLQLSGPTSFAPVIEMAMKIVEDSRGLYHVLLIIADGQVTRSSKTPQNELSPQEQMTIDAIVRASEYPLSIILVGVGDGPWDMMREFDDNIPERAFDNFQFVNFTEIMSKNMDPVRKEAEFALAALMEIPSQYKATLELSILGCQTQMAPNRRPLPPPASTGSSFRSFRLKSYRQNSNRLSKKIICPVCQRNIKNMAFDCGHQACFECGVHLKLCPTCRKPITTRIKLYPS